MLKRNKHLIIGFLLGALLFGIIPVGASIQEYILTQSSVKIIVDGEELINNDVPILYMPPGYNYLPAAIFREVCTKMGIGFEYVNETNEIRIDTNKNKISVNEVTDSITPTKKERLTTINEIEYIEWGEAQKYIIHNNNDYFLYYNADIKKAQVIEKSNNTPIVTDIPVHIFDNIYIEYDYFKNNIIPLFK